VLILRQQMKHVPDDSFLSWRRPATPAAAFARRDAARSPVASMACSLSFGEKRWVGENGAKRR